MKEPKFDDDPVGWARRFWDLGFFRSGVGREAANPSSGLDDADGPEAVARLLQDRSQPNAVGASSEDLRLLSYDPYRVVVADEESDVYPRDHLLQRLVEAELPRISRGAFIPSAVVEVWRDDWGRGEVWGPEGIEPPVEDCHCRRVARPKDDCPHYPVHLNIRPGWGRSSESPGWGGREFRSVPLRYGMLDTAFVHDINALVDPEGPGLYVFGDGGQGMAFIFLKAGDARAMVRDRGWRPWHQLGALPVGGHPVRPLRPLHLEEPESQRAFRPEPAGPARP